MAFGQGCRRATVNHMSPHFEELDYQPTAIGAISLRRRRELLLDTDVYEIKLDDEFLMSSLFTASERALARLALAAVEAPHPKVLVGGLGLGYTAAEVLAHSNVASLTVVELLDPVIDWHQRRLVPMSERLVGDSRCGFQCADFFAAVSSEAGFDSRHPGRRYDAILLDIDHAPDTLLDERSNAFYRAEGLADLLPHLAAGGVFGLWSNDPPDAAFLERLEAVFARAWMEPVIFDNPYQDKPVTQTVYLGAAAS